MTSTANKSEVIIREAANSLAIQKAGGLHRRSIGKASAKVKRRHRGGKLMRIIIGLVGLFAAMTVAGLILDGIGFWGLMGSIILGVVMVGVLSRYPKLKVPERADLKTDNVGRLVSQTELWLEAQRKSLPPPAAKMVTYIGNQLDGLQVQLQEVDQQHPTAGQIRKLVGEDLPEMIDGYRKIPEKMRYEERAGSTPNKQLLDGLELVSNEIDSVTRQLAQGSLDDLAIRTRYLDYKYGGEEMDAKGD